MIKIRIEGTAEEIEVFMNQNFKPLLGKVNSVSKFYPNKREQNSFFPTSRAIGRVYVEVD